MITDARPRPWGWLAPAMLVVTLLAVLLPTTTRAAPLPFDRDLSIPPVVEDTGAPVQCTVAYLINDVVTNDTFLLRMRISPAQTVRAVRNRLPCPASIPPRFAVRALDACTVRVDDPNQCVYADMARGFERDPVIRNTASNGARCQSDQSEFIAIACARKGGLEVCSVACGGSAAEARQQARARCEDKHQASCPVVTAAEVAVPP